MKVFEQLDRMGHEQVVFFQHKDTGLKAIVAIHNTTLGPALGGLRMWPYASDDDALKDVLRLRILITLAESGEMTVTELARVLRISQPLVSFHLNPLRVLGLVQVRRVGREVYCSVNLGEIQRRQDVFTAILAGDES